MFVEEFIVCHNFVSDCVQYILPPHERKIVDVSHLVGAE